MKTKNITIEKLRERLSKEKLHFQYKKKDGSLRDAHGTLCEEYIPPEMLPKDNSSNYKNLKYFDLDKNEWRSISSDVDKVKLL